MIRIMTEHDFEQFWPTFESIIKAQETYAFEPDMTQVDAYEIWCELPIKTFVYVEGESGNEQILGSYYLKANAAGPSKHIANCGYMVSSSARGKGIAAKMCEHSQQQALAHGFKAMQFNSVVSTNTTAVALWKRLGFEVIGVIPKAYQHPKLGMVDCLIMYKWLADDVT